MNANIRVCMITDDPSDLGGGPEHIRRVSSYLRKKYSWTIEIITPRVMNSSFVFSNIFSRLIYLFWLCRFILLSDFDIYHSHSFSTSLVVPLARLKGKKCGITVHGMGVNLVGAGLFNKTGIPKILAKIVLYFWPYNFRLSASSLKGFVIVGNGIDIGEFLNLKHKKTDKFTVLCISRRDPVKGVEILEKAMSFVSGSRLNLVSGRKRSLSDFESADCYVLPSLSEGLPIVLLEAMAAKLPIITTNVGDCGELIRKSKSGYVCKPGSPTILAKEIEKMKLSKERKKMGINGFEFVKKNYNWERVSEIIALEYLRP